MLDFVRDSTLIPFRSGTPFSWDLCCDEAIELVKLLSLGICAVTRPLNLLITFSCKRKVGNYVVFPGSILLKYLVDHQLRVTVNLDLLCFYRCT